MNQLNELAQLLEAKLRLLLNYESISLDMLECKTDMLTPLFAKRGQLARQIDEIDFSVRQVCKSASDSALLLNAVYNRCDYSDLPKEYTPFFRQGQQIFAAASRINTLNPQIELRLTQLKDEAEQMLKELNSGNAAKASRFNSGIDSSSRYHSSLGNA